VNGPNSRLLWGGGTLLGVGTEPAGDGFGVGTEPVDVLLELGVRSGWTNCTGGDSVTLGLLINSVASLTLVGTRLRRIAPPADVVVEVAVDDVSLA
jgi:hypothetical protein